MADDKTVYADLYKMARDLNAQLAASGAPPADSGCSGSPRGVDVQKVEDDAFARGFQFAMSLVPKALSRVKDDPRLAAKPKIQPAKAIGGAPAAPFEQRRSRAGLPPAATGQPSAAPRRRPAGSSASSSAAAGPSEQPGRTQAWPIGARNPAALRKQLGEEAKKREAAHLKACSQSKWSHVYAAAQRKRPPRTWPDEAPPQGKASGAHGSVALQLRSTASSSGAGAGQMPAAARDPGLRTAARP